MSKQDRQQIAITTLIETGSNQAACDAAGVTDRQLRRWRQQPDFQLRLFLATGAKTYSASTMATSMAPGVLTGLVDLMKSDDPNIRLKAYAEWRQLEKQLSESALRRVEIDQAHEISLELDEIIRNGIPQHKEDQDVEDDSENTGESDSE